MASQVLSGSSNAVYVNNTTQNVRVVINYMASFAQFGTTLLGRNTVISHTLSLNWANGTASARDDGQTYLNPDTRQTEYIPPQPIAIGRNLSFFSIGFVVGDPTISVRNPDTSWSSAPGKTRSMAVTGNNMAARPFLINQSDYGGLSLALPTEIMLNPGERFSSICGSYNIVIIPENG
jgi:hypothetical protein